MTPKPPFDQPLRPLAQLLPRPDGDDALVFETRDREVRVEGAPGLVSRVLSRCDGTRTGEQIASEFDDGAASDVLALIETLAEHRIVVDCTQAYRLFHQQSSVGSGLFREVSSAQSMALARRYFEPRDLLDTRVSLPPDPLSLRDLLRHRSSAMPGTSRPVSFSELATVLAATYGTEGKTRTVPSAGDLYPLVLHILVRKRLASLDPGLWWFDPSRTELRLVREGAIDLQPLIFAHWAVDPLVASGEPVVFISADLEHSAAKYSNRGYRYTLMEAGAAMQNAYLAAAELRLPIRAVGGFDDDPLHEALDLPDRVAPLLVILLGS